MSAQVTLKEDVHSLSDLLFSGVLSNEVKLFVTFQSIVCHVRALRSASSDPSFMLEHSILLTFSCSVDKLVKRVVLSLYFHSIGRSFRANSHESKHIHRFSYAVDFLSYSPSSHLLIKIRMLRCIASFGYPFPSHKRISFSSSSSQNSESVNPQVPCDHISEHSNLHSMV
ncbi:unnamed protein product [Protopolystoma xenopodis]|uniref:Uncharacterized protein n=1 Tax=Protopolystoma xenopodis TaxID=117903 RepID=A0A3S5CHH2_9PLAT|nr:unnamed protein product [Protopolystoma xenopodis]